MGKEVGRILRLASSGILGGDNREWKCHFALQVTWGCWAGARWLWCQPHAHLRRKYYVMKNVSVACLVILNISAKISKDKQFWSPAVIEPRVTISGTKNITERHRSLEGTLNDGR